MHARAVNLDLGDGDIREKTCDGEADTGFWHESSQAVTPVDKADITEGNPRSYTPPIPANLASSKLTRQPGKSAFA